MQLKEIMSKEIKTVTGDTTLQEAAKKMSINDVGSLPVVKNKRLIGIVTDRDLVVRGISRGLDPRSSRIDEVYTSEVEVGYEGEDIKQAVQVMRKKQIRRLPVVNQKKELVGIIALADVATEVKDENLTGKTLKDISKTEHN